VRGRKRRQREKQEKALHRRAKELGYKIEKVAKPKPEAESK
jgi:hypothetical protein